MEVFMKGKTALFLCLFLILITTIGFGQSADSGAAKSDNTADAVPAPATEEKESELRNYIGFTPTFILMGMYGLVYSYAMDNNVLLTVVGGYTNFDLSPITFLHNKNYVYQNAYAGINVTIFPFSDRMFPRGFYFGFDFVPSLGFSTNRSTKALGTGISLSGDVLVGYSWIFGNFIKLSVDVFLNINTPGIHLSGEDWNPDNNWVVLPFFDINIGIVF
jgi:hypothetical protein